jgi:hypothetical protein
LLLALGLYGAPAPAVADAPDAVGQVAALSGNVVAQRSGEPPRPLGCRDTVYQGEWVVTSKGSHAGILLGELLAHVGERSALRVGLTPSATADMILETGAVRVIDPRDTGALAQLAVLDAEEKAAADPGKCVIAKPSEPLYLADAHDQRLGTPAEDACPLGPVIGALDQHLSPADVAAGPPQPPWSSAPTGPARPPRSPCEPSAAGCARGGGGNGGGGGGGVSEPGLFFPDPIFVPPAGGEGGNG